MDFISFIATIVVVAVILAWVKFVKLGPVYQGKELLEGKTVLITGGSYGIGKETAVELAKRRARVIIASRNEEKATEALFDIRMKSGNGMVLFMKLDLSDFGDVRRFAKEFIESEPRLDILVNNAGIVGHGITKDGNDLILATNQLGPFLLTNLLLPLMKTTAKYSPVRVVNVSADAYMIGQINFDKLNLGLRDSSSVTLAVKQYSNTKLMNIYFTSELNRRLRADDPHSKSITTFSLHPGVISTYLGSYFIQSSIIFRILRMLAGFIMTRSLFYGCQTTLYCCLQEGLENESGGYFSNLKRRKLKPHASNAETGRKLWKICEEMTGL